MLAARTTLARFSVSLAINNAEVGAGQRFPAYFSKPCLHPAVGERSIDFFVEPPD
jgi:hypothetical protein